MAWVGRAYVWRGEDRVREGQPRGHVSPDPTNGGCPWGLGADTVPAIDLRPQADRARGAEVLGTLASRKSATGPGCSGATQVEGYWYIVICCVPRWSLVKWTVSGMASIARVGTAVHCSTNSFWGSRTNFATRKFPRRPWSNELKLQLFMAVVVSLWLHLSHR
jgi:hypothetical protein